MSILIQKLIMEAQVFANTQKGFIALVSILLIGAVGAAIAISVVLLGIGSSRIGFSVDQSNQAKAIADACVEEALLQIRSNSSFSGSNDLNLGLGSCTYTVNNPGGENRTIGVIATIGSVNTVVRKVTVTINKIYPKISVYSWLETP